MMKHMDIHRQNKKKITCYILHKNSQYGPYSKILDEKL